MLPEGLLPLIIDRDFIADLTDTVTSCFSYSMVISLRLRDVIGCNWVSVSAHDLLSRISEYLPPCFDAVVADALGHIVSVKAHPWHKCNVELSIVVLILTILDDEEERARAEA